MRHANRNLPARAAVCAALAVLLGACAVSTPITVQSTGFGFAPVTAIQLPPTETGESRRALFDTALRRILAKRSITIDPAATLVADYGVSLRDAETGLAQPQDSGQQIDWSSRPRKGRLLDGCKAMRLRATLVLLSRIDGTAAYHGAAEADGCTATAQELDRMAQALVEDALASAQR